MFIPPGAIILTVSNVDIFDNQVCFDIKKDKPDSVYQN